MELEVDRLTALNLVGLVKTRFAEERRAIYEFPDLPVQMDEMVRRGYQSVLDQLETQLKEVGL